jgi:hypothetical protein
LFSAPSDLCCSHVSLCRPSESDLFFQISILPFIWDLNDWFSTMSNEQLSYGSDDPLRVAGTEHCGEHGKGLSIVLTRLESRRDHESSSFFDSTSIQRIYNISSPMRLSTGKANNERSQDSKMVGTNGDMNLRIVRFSFVPFKAWPRILAQQKK